MLEHCGAPHTCDKRENECNMSVSAPSVWQLAFMERAESLNNAISYLFPLLDPPYPYTSPTLLNLLLALLSG